MDPGHDETYRRRVLRVLLYIEEHLDDDLTRDRLAAVACFSPYHFHRIFTAFTGEPLHKYIRRLRLERAVARLVRSTQPVTRIAFEAGFETHEAFSRAFRQAYDLSPRDVRSGATNGKPIFLHPEQSLHLKPIGETTMDVRVEKLNPKRIAFLRHVGPYAGIGEKFQRLCAWAGSKGAMGPDTEVLGVYHDNPEVTPPEKLRSDATLTVDDGVTAEGDVQVGEIAGGPYAIATHKGSYAGLMESYRWLYGVWLPQSGHDPADAPCFEKYLNSPEDTAEDDLLTEIHVPLR